MTKEVSNDVEKSETKTKKKPPPPGPLSSKMKGTWLKIFMKEEDTTPFGMHIFIIENIHIFGGIWIIFSHLETEEYIPCMLHTYIVLHYFVSKQKKVGTRSRYS